MSTYGPPGPGQPDDPYQRPSAGHDGPPPVDPTLPQWGPPPAGGAEPPTAPLWGQPPAASQPPGGAYPPPPSGAGYPPPPGGAYPPPSSGAGYPPPGPFPPAGPQAAGQWGAPTPAGYGTPPPPAKKHGGRIALIIALVVLLLLCPCLGLAGWAVWQAAEDDGGSASPAASSSAAPTGEPSEEPTAEPTTAEPSPSEDEGSAFAKGDCVVNDGTDNEPELRKVPCARNTYEVLLRIPATTDGDRCETLAPTATANYVHDAPVDVFDFVLCLKKRTR